MNQTVEQVFPLVATMVSVGVLVNILAATGVRGLIAISFVALPIIGIYATSLAVCPLAQGSLGFGSAVILGTPLIFVFNAVGANVTVVAAAFSMLFALGDCLPPSRIVGRTAIETVGYKGSYAIVPEGHRRAVARHGDRGAGDADLPGEGGVLGEVLKKPEARSKQKEQHRCIGFSSGF